MLTEIHGDLFTTQAPLIAHGVNCRGAFGSGVAGQIAKRWPGVKSAYLRKFDREGWQLGDVQILVAGGLTIANLATQSEYGRSKTGQAFASITAIEKSLNKLFVICCSFKIKIDHIAMPRLGCGLGGLQWDAVRPTIEAISNDFDINVEVYFNGWPANDPNRDLPARKDW